MKPTSRSALAVAALALLVAAGLVLLRQPNPKPEPTAARPAPPSAQTAAPAAALAANADRLRHWARNASANPSAAEELQRLAAERRALLLPLIQSNPPAAFDAALSYADYAALPPEVQAVVERPFSAAGHLQRFAVCDRDPRTPEYRQLLRLPDQPPLQLPPRHPQRAAVTKQGLPLQGIALEGWTALRPDALQALHGPDRDWAEATLPLANPAPATDFLSGEVIDGPPLVAIAGGHRFHFAGRDSLERLNAALERLDRLPLASLGSPAFLERLADRDASPFSLDAFVAEQEQSFTAQTEQTRKYLIIRVDFEDKNGSPFSKTGLEDLVDSAVAPALADYSYHKTSVDVEVSLKIYRLGPSSNYGDEQDIHTDAVTAYIDDGNTDPSSVYDHVSVSFPSLEFPWAGLASIGGRNQWLQGRVSAETILHELGHNYGLSHASYWIHDASDETSTDPVDPSGSNEEYGDIFDNMGDGGVAAGHFHMAAKQYLGWLEESDWNDVATPAENGAYRLYRFDDGSATGLQALRVAKSATSDHYWVGFRQRYPGVANFDQGAYLVWERAASPNNFNNRSWLVDTSPGSPDGKLDAGVPLGKTYSDPASQVHITPIAAGQDNAGPYLDVAVRLGDFSGNQPPSGSLSATASGQARSPLSFSFSGSDPDGDDLAYHWDFGDGTVELNAASVDHSFPVGGTYTLTLTVSDLKGGSYSEQATIEVSDPINEVNDRSGATTRNLRALAANDVRVVAGGSGGALLHSSDGQDWSPVALGFGTQNVGFNDILWTGSAFIAVGQDFDFDNGVWIGVVYESADGLSWTRVLEAPTNVGFSGFSSVAHDPVTQVTVVARDDAQIHRRSSDGQWSVVGLDLPSPSTNTDQLSTSVAWTGSAFVLGGYNFDQPNDGPKLVLQRSPDGLAWTDVSADSGFQNWHGLDAVAHLNGTLLGSGFFASTAYSLDDGQTWTSNIQGNPFRSDAFAFGNAIYSSVGAIQESGQPEQPQTFLSTDGRNWKAAGAPPNGIAYNDRVFFQDTFISVADNGVIHQSSPFQAPEQSPFNAWIVGYVTDEQDQGALANPDQDWAPNFMEFALGSDPTDPNSAPRQPVLSFTDQGNAVVAIDRYAKTEVLLSLWISTDLVDWQPLPAAATVDTATLLELTSTQPLSPADALFIRVQASQP